MIPIIAGELIERDHAYVTDDGVYMSVESVDDYGLLAHQSVDDMRSGGGDREVVGAAGKRHPADFVLWKFATGPATESDPAWPSPWGPGRPGWHSECVVMSLDLLGEGFDLALRIAYPSDSSLVARPIASIPRYFCASPDYLARRGTPEIPVDLLHHDCLHYNLISEREEWTFRGKDGDQTVLVNGVFCSNNGEVLAEAAMQGLGITLLPDFIVAQALNDGHLVRILEGWERSPLALSVLYPSRQHVPAKARLFIEYLIEHFG